MIVAADELGIQGLDRDPLWDKAHAAAPGYGSFVSFNNAPETTGEDVILLLKELGAEAVGE